MAVHQPPRKRGSGQRPASDLDRALRHVQRNGGGYAPKKKSSSVPWWGWAIFIFLGLKACGMASQYTSNDAPPPSVPTTVTQGGQ